MDPLDVRPPARLVEHARGRIEPAQSPGMAGLPRHMQQRSRPAPHVEHGPRGHYQRQIEGEVVPPRRWVEHIIQCGEAVLGKLVLDHAASLLAPSHRSKVAEDATAIPAAPAGQGPSLISAIGHLSFLVLTD